MPEKMYFGSGKTLDEATARLYRTADREKAGNQVGDVEIALTLREKRKLLAEGEYASSYDKAFQLVLQGGCLKMQYILEHKDRISVVVNVKAAFKPQEKSKDIAKGKPSGCAMPEHSPGRLTDLL